jgi:trimethylamine--corrinoid protein Co-methyltransferase
MNKPVVKAFKKGIYFEKKAQFEKAKGIYEDLINHATDATILKNCRLRLEDIDDLIIEKSVYQSIDEDAKKVLTDIGINFTDCHPLMDILLEAKAVDLNSHSAIFIPLNRDYIDRCLELVPREMPLDPGLNTFGTGATSPFLKRNGDEDLRPANRKEYEKIIHSVSEAQDVFGTNNQEKTDP